MILWIEMFQVADAVERAVLFEKLISVMNNEEFKMAAILIGQSQYDNIVTDASTIAFRYKNRLFETVRVE